jgi:hypothetical protein
MSETGPPSASFARGLTEAWEGELFGEALMRRLRHTLADAAPHEAELAQIARVECLMGRALATAIADRDVPAAMVVAEARAKIIAARYTGWNDFLADSIPAMAAPLARFRALAPLAPAPCKMLVDLLIEHEEMLDRYLQECAAGTEPKDNGWLTGIERKLEGYLLSASA